MEEAVYKELKEICSRIMELDNEESPAAYLADLRVIEEKLILLDYLRYRNRNLNKWKVSTQEKPSDLDQEILDTLIQADREAEINERRQQAQSSPLQKVMETEIEESQEEEVVAEAPIPEVNEPVREPIMETPPVSTSVGTTENRKRSINDNLARGQIKLGLNDRLAFTHHLFSGSQEDLNRVISQINTFESLREALDFMESMIKPDYDWAQKEDYEERFMALIRARFGED